MKDKLKPTAYAVKNKAEKAKLRNAAGEAPCKACLRHKKTSYPKVVEVDGLFYAQCPECNYYDRHDFLAVTHKKAITRWNDAMEGAI